MVSSIATTTTMFSRWSWSQHCKPNAPQVIHTISKANVVIAQAMATDRMARRSCISGGIFSMGVTDGLAREMRLAYR